MWKLLFYHLWIQQQSLYFSKVDLYINIKKVGIAQMANKVNWSSCVLCLRGIYYSVLGSLDSHHSQCVWMRRLHCVRVRSPWFVAPGC